MLERHLPAATHGPYTAVRARAHAARLLIRAWDELLLSVLLTSP